MSDFSWYASYFTALYIPLPTHSAKIFKFTHSSLAMSSWDSLFSFFLHPHWCFLLIMSSLLHLCLSLSAQRSLEVVMKSSMTAVQSPTLMLPLWWPCGGGPCFTLWTSSSPVCSSPPWPFWSSCSLPTRGRRSAWVRNNMGNSKKGWIWENGKQAVYNKSLISL